MAKKGGGGGGSQLAQLKSRLRSEGISDRRQMKASAKKRKHGQAGVERDEAQARRDRLEAISSSSQFNPFEEKITKPKNVVLGRKIRGATGKPGEAKMGGLQDRRAHLLPEWTNRNKSGSFVDRRFGENEGSSSNMSVEDKMLERFTREQQQRRDTSGPSSRTGKASLFNLDDAEEEGLTHYGRSLNDLDNYDDIRLSDEEGAEDGGQDHARFGGFEEDDAEDEERQKSKAEVMKEVIAKSKLYKHERQQVKAADEELRQELDDGLGDIRDLLFSSKPSLAESAAEQAKDNPSTDAKLPLFGSGPKKADAYDSAVRAMAFERRAKPQDRLKTEAEKAEELATKLQKAEQNRLKRMRGDGVSDDEDGSRRSKSRRPAGGDDLEDDFELDGMTSQDVYGLGRGLDAEEAAKDSDEEDDAVKQLDGDKSGDDKTAKLDKYQNEEVVDDDDDTNSGDGEDEDEDEDEDDFADLADVDALAQPGEEDFSDAGEQETLVKSRKDTMKSKPSRTLPFTFACPANLDAFLDMLSASDIQLADIPVVVKRIRALHHPSLAEANKFKLQALIGVLIDYILHISSTLDEVNKTTTMLVINALVPQIFTLTKTYPVPSSEHFVSKLNLMQRNLTRGLSRGALATDSRTWPGIAECVLLKITGMVWPTSDRSHAVTTPLALLISQYLSSCRIRSLQDIARGMFLCSLVVTNERQSARLVPEACNFLHNAISLLAPISSRKQLARLNHAHGIPWPDFGQEHTASIRLTETDKDEEVRPGKVDFVGMVSMSKPREASSSQVMAQMKASLLSSAFALIGELQRMYMGSVAYVELMRPFETLLTKLVKDLPHALEAQRQAVLGPLSRAVSNSAKQRRALRLQAHRAIPLASHVPKFDQGFDPTRKGGKTFDPDAQRAEQAKLRALVKKERKGAVRELRRDNEFLAEARRKAREEEDQRYAKSIDKIMGSFSAERGEEKAYLKEKQKIKRRAGKK